MDVAGLPSRAKKISTTPPVIRLFTKKCQVEFQTLIFALQGVTIETFAPLDDASNSVNF